jgi:hypothetical protein
MDAGNADHRMVRTEQRDVTIKRKRMTRDWSDMNAYADAKTGVIEQIKGRASPTRREPSASSSARANSPAPDEFLMAITRECEGWTLRGAR